MVLCFEPKEIMYDYGLNDIRYKILKGIDFDVRVCPDRMYAKPFNEGANKNSDDADVCLSCTRKKCSGGKKCYEKRRDLLLKEKKKLKKLSDGMGR